MSNHTGTPLISSTTCRNAKKSSSTKWFRVMPKLAVTVSIRSSGPPVSSAELIRATPPPGMSTRRSLGSDITHACSLTGSTRRIVMLSAKNVPLGSYTRSMLTGSSGSSRSALSLPITRKFTGSPGRVSARSTSREIRTR